MEAVAGLIGAATAWGAWSYFQGWDERRRVQRWRKLTGQAPGKETHWLMFPWVVWPLERLRRRRRRKIIWHKLPDVFDLLALGLSTGLNFERSFELMVDLLPAGELRSELGVTCDLLKLGRSREEIFLELKGRLNNERANGVFALLLQSFKRGSPLQDLLFEQASYLRREQMRVVERRAQTIGLRLLFPIMIFIFPSIFLILFGALYLSYLRSGFFF